MDDLAVFCRLCAHGVLKNKKILMFGDSNLRAIYKDMIWLCKNDCLISRSRLRQRFETSYLGDRLQTNGTLHAGRHYEEARLYIDFELHIEFRFMTRCCNDDFKSVMWDIRNEYRYVPDVVVISSCVWDLTRWGPDGIDQYMQNVDRTMRTLQWCVPPETSVVWLTATPPSFGVRGGFLVRRLEFLRSFLPWHVTEANQFVYETALSFGRDVLDMRFYLQTQLHRRAEDGIHWEPDAVRFSTNLLLSYILRVTNGPVDCAHPPVSRGPGVQDEDRARKRKNDGPSGDAGPKRSKLSG